jgi:hypothetical protein
VIDPLPWNTIETSAGLSWVPVAKWTLSETRNDEKWYLLIAAADEMKSWLKTGLP